MLALKHKILFFALVIHSIPAMAAKGPIVGELVCSHKGKIVMTEQHADPRPHLSEFVAECAKNQICYDGQCTACVRNAKGYNIPPCQGVPGTSKDSKSKAGKPNTKNTKLKCGNGLHPPDCVN